MNLFVTALVSCMVISAFAEARGGSRCRTRGGRIWGGRRGSGIPRRNRRPPPNIYDMFPTCGTFEELISVKYRELQDSGEIGPGNCQDGDHKVCMQRDMETVRCAVSEEPEQACIDEMMAFIQGDVCNGERGEDGGDSVDSTDEDSP